MEDSSSLNSLFSGSSWKVALPEEPQVSHLSNACLVVPWMLEDTEDTGVLKAWASIPSVPVVFHLAMLWLGAG